MVFKNKMFVRPHLNMQGRRKLFLVGGAVRLLGRYNRILAMKKTALLHVERFNLLKI